MFFPGNEFMSHEFTKGRKQRGGFVYNSFLVLICLSILATSSERESLAFCFLSVRARYHFCASLFPVDANKSANSLSLRRVSRVSSSHKKRGNLLGWLGTTRDSKSC